MQKKAFSLLHAMERSWWYRGRKIIARTVLNRFIGTNKKLKVLDFGAGYGGMLDILKPFGSVDAYEVESSAISSCMERGYDRVSNKLEEVFGASDAYDLVTLFDVVEHVENDTELSDSLYRVLKPGGHVIITVPAFQFLWSVHDVEHNHYSRYTT